MDTDKKITIGISAAGVFISLISLGVASSALYNTYNQRKIADKALILANRPRIHVASAIKKWDWANGDMGITLIQDLINVGNGDAQKIATWYDLVETSDPQTATDEFRTVLCTDHSLEPSTAVIYKGSHDRKTIDVNTENADARPTIPEGTPADKIFYILVGCTRYKFSDFDTEITEMQAYFVETCDVAKKCEELSEKSRLKRPDHMYLHQISLP